MRSAAETVKELVARYGESDVAILAQAVEWAIEQLWIRDDVASSEVPSEVGHPWDVIVNEVTASLGENLPDVEPVLDEHLWLPEFRIALRDWHREHGAPELSRGAEDDLSFAAIDALARLDLDRCLDAMDQLYELDASNASALRSELPIGDHDPSTEILHLWRVLDARSPTVFHPTEVELYDQVITSDLGERASIQAETEERRQDGLGEKTEPVPGPAEKGRTLEDSLRAALAIVFDLENASGWKLRTQKSGSQFGFDVSFTAPDVANRSLCLFECKNYSTALTLRHVADKVLQADSSWPDNSVDHWILVTSHTDPVNDLDRTVEKWNTEQRFPFTVQIWSPSTGVRDLFQLDSALYQAVYGEKVGTLSKDRRTEIVEDFHRRLEPPLRIPRAFIGSVREGTPVQLPTDDPSWPELLGQHLPRGALNEAKAPIAGSLMSAVMTWINENQGQAESLLLLADFGEGKSFFLYELCTALLSRFRDDPAESPLPLRFCLRDFQRIDSPKAFLELQLGYYGASLVDLGDLRTRSSVVLMLDGIDEMSVRQDGKAITDNLQKLQELLQLVANVPVILSSRPHFFESDAHRTRFHDRLRRPRVYRLGQPPRSDRLTHLHEFATATDTVEKLRRVKKLYDPIGLSAKVLFLEMLKATLEALPEDEFSEAVLYETYIDQALRRKIPLLDDPGARTHHDALVADLSDLLNLVAVKIHGSESGTVDLRQFRDELALAEKLWHVAGPETGELSYDIELDAAARVGMRSLLKRAGVADDDPREWTVEFSHRSLKEYFVARAILAAVQSPDYEPGGSSAPADVESRAGDSPFPRSALTSESRCLLETSSVPGELGGHRYR